MYPSLFIYLYKHVGCVAAYKQKGFCCWSKPQWQTLQISEKNNIAILEDAFEVHQEFWNVNSSLFHFAIFFPASYTGVGENEVEWRGASRGLCSHFAVQFVK